MSVTINDRGVSELVLTAAVLPPASSNGYLMATVGRHNAYAK